MPEIRLAKTRAAYAACFLCHGHDWVCEAHPERPFPHESCPGPGDPCPLCHPELIAASGFTANVIDGGPH